MKRPHINADGQFQSDKYPSCPPGKVPLSVKDPMAQELLWEYAQRRRSVDPEFSEDLETALKSAGYKPSSQARFTEPVRLPDGSGFFTASLPLPKDHWLYAEGRNDPPMPMRTGVGAKRNELADQIKAAARHAIRASTMNGKEPDFDPDAMVQNMIVGLLGYWTDTGR